MKKPDLFSAHHPIRIMAADIIELVIAPHIGRPIKTEEYYELEDELVRTIVESKDAISRRNAEQRKKEALDTVRKNKEGKAKQIDR